MKIIRASLTLSLTLLAARAEDFSQWAQRPTLGWNSYDAFGDSVTEAEVLANARYMHDQLAAHGWEYIIVDFRWYDPEPTGDDHLLNKTRVGAKLSADANGQLLPAPNRFPSAADGKGFHALAENLHAQKLKFGIHVMRGIPRQAVKAATPIADSNFTAADAANTGDTCEWCPDMFGVRTNAAGQAWYDSIFRLYASWGLDFVKVDDLSQPYHAGEIEMIRRAIDKCGRPIVFSTSPGETPVAMSTHIQSQANMWRISGDFWDKWDKIKHQFTLLARWQGVGGAGHWPDADMIPFGHLCIRSGMGGREHLTHFTPDEERALMSLWAIARSPLMLGMHLPDNDAFTLSLLTNDEVLAVNQSSTNNRQLFNRDGLIAWTADAPGSPDKYLALFNTRDANTDAPDAAIAVPLADLGFGGACKVRYLWNNADVGVVSGEFTDRVNWHGGRIFRLTPVAK